MFYYLAFFFLCYVLWSSFKLLAPVRTFPSLNSSSTIYCYCTFFCFFFFCLFFYFFSFPCFLIFLFLFGCYKLPLSSDPILEISKQEVLVCKEKLSMEFSYRLSWSFANEDFYAHLPKLLSESLCAYKLCFSLFFGDFFFSLFLSF